MLSIAYKPVVVGRYVLATRDGGTILFVFLVSFAREHKHMLADCKEMLEYRNGLVAIHPRFNRLITSLRTAVENGEGTLDMEAT